MTLGFIGSRPSRCNFLRASLRARRNGFRLLSDFPFGGFLVVAAELHLPEDALALHLFFQRPQRLVDIVVADKNLHERSSSMQRLAEVNATVSRGTHI